MQQLPMVMWTSNSRVHLVADWDLYTVVSRLRSWDDRRDAEACDRVVVASSNFS
jgi:hypothetical protein